MSEVNTTLPVEIPADANVTIQDIHQPEDIAAAFFQRSKPVLKKLLGTMSAKQMRRFVMHVGSYPHHDKGDLPRTEEEKKAAYILNEMMFNKTIMQLAAEAQKVDEAQKQEELQKELNNESN